MSVFPKIELFNEDCFEGIKRLPPKSVHLVLTDPPFNNTNLDWDKMLINLKELHQL